MGRTPKTPSCGCTASAKGLAYRIDRGAGPLAKSKQRERVFFMPDQIVKSPDNARAASKEGVVRYVLAISVVLVVILFIVGYLVS
jgi:hypothetical protein